MDMREIAEKLIVAVGGDDSDKNIAGVVDVFEGIRNGLNLLWEQHIINTANEQLAMYRVTCKQCGHKTRIQATNVNFTIGHS